MIKLKVNLEKLGYTIGDPVIVDDEWGVDHGVVTSIFTHDMLGGTWVEYTDQYGGPMITCADETITRARA